MKTFLLTNDLHKTRFRVHVEAQPSIGYALSRHQVRRIRLALCGVTDCTCDPSQLNVRGPQPEARVERFIWNASAPVYVLYERGEP